MSRNLLFTSLAALSISCWGPARGNESPGAVEVEFACPVAELSATLLLPHAHGKMPCVVILGGSLSQDRDGALLGRPAPPRDALRRLAEALAREGYASLRYDRPGFGKSRKTAEWKGTYSDEAKAAAAALRFAQARPEVSSVVAAAESAGAYLACLAAKDGVSADGYIFLGGLCGPSEEMYAYNFGRLAAYAESKPERLEWAMKTLRRDLALGRRYRELFAAARAGQSRFELVDGDYRSQEDLPRRIEELAMPPEGMFRHIHSPVLALQGERDRNVPPGHAQRIVEVVKGVGVTDATSVVIAGADHSFQLVPESEEEQIRLRYTFESFKLPYAPRLDAEVAAWLGKRFPPAAEVRPAAREAAPRDASK